MKIVKKGTMYEVESASSKGKFYKVDPARKTCNCPAFLYRYSKVGLLCKHLEAVMDMAGDVNHTGPSELLGQIRKEGPIDTVEALEKYGEEEVDSLIQSGELIEERGKLRILE